MTIASEVRKLSPSALIELYILDTAPIGGNSLDYFFAGTSPAQKPIVFQGKEYMPWALESEGFEKNGQGAMPKPRMTVANVDGIMSLTVSQFKDLVGARLVRKRTFAKFLDAVNFPSDDYVLALNSGSVQLPSVPELAIARGSWTVEARVLLTQASSTEWSQWLGSYAGGIGVGVSSSGGFRVTLTGVADAPPSLFQPALNTQYHFVAAYDFNTKTLRYYVNGTLVNSVPWDYQNNGSETGYSIVVGTSPVYAADMHGWIKDLRIYKKVLNGTQVSSAYTGGAMYGPVASYNCQEIGGTILHDSIAGLNGTLSASGAAFQARAYNNPDADPTQEFPIDVFFISRKVSENPTAIEFELTSALDLQGVQLPSRQVLQNSCSWIYRSADCSWTGGFFDKHDQPTSNPLEDQCSKRINGCKVRFGATAVLPFGGFPGARRYS